MKSRPTASLVILALVTVQVLFGLNYVISKVIVNAFPPLVWASIRSVLAASILIGAALLSKRASPKGKSFFVPLIVFALLGSVINQASFLVGLHYTTPTNAAILNALIPVFTLIIVTLRGQEPLTLIRMVGFACALAGVLVLRHIEEFRFSDQTAIGDMLMIVNCVSYALYLSFAKKFIETHDRLWTTAWQFLYASIGIGLMATPDWAHFEIPHMTGVLWGSAAYAIVGGTLITYFLNNWSLAWANPSQVAVAVYIQPVIAAVFAWMWLGTEITSRTVFSSLLIFLGLFFALVLPSTKKDLANPKENSHVA